MACRSSSKDRAPARTGAARATRPAASTSATCVGLEKRELDRGSASARVRPDRNCGSHDVGTFVAACLVYTYRPVTEPKHQAVLTNCPSMRAVEHAHVIQVGRELALIPDPSLATVARAEYQALLPDYRAVY